MYDDISHLHPTEF